MRGSLVLGILGCIFGVLGALLAAFLGTLLGAFGFANNLEINALVAIIGSIIGIAGAVNGRKLGGVLMIVGGIIVLVGISWAGVLGMILFVVGGILALREKPSSDTIRQAMPYIPETGQVCSKCGSINKQIGAFCWNCGSPLNSSVETPPQSLTRAAVPSYPHSRLGKKSHGIRNVLIVLWTIFLILLLLGVTANFFVSNSSPLYAPPPPQQPTNSSTATPTTNTQTSSTTTSSTTASSSTPSGVVNSGTLTISCASCSGSNPNNYLWSGSVDNAGTSVSYDGNLTQSYTLQRGSNSFWIVSWEFQKSTTAGTLVVTFTLDNGTIVNNANTTASYGLVSGAWSYLTPYS